MPQRYTVKNNESGDTITFDWEGDAPPTDADLEEVFAAHAAQKNAMRPVASHAPASPRGTYKQYGPLADLMRMQAEPAVTQEETLETLPVAAGVAASMLPGLQGFAAPLLAGATATGATDYAINRDAGRAATRAGQDLLMGGAVGAGGRLAIAGAQAAKPVLGEAMGLAGRGLYRNALKNVATPEVADKLTEVGIREGINSSRGGWFRANTLASELGDEVTRLVRTLDGNVDPQRGLAMVRSYRDRLSRSAAPESDVAAVNDLLAQYEQKFSSPMPAAKGHELKKEIWRRNETQFDKNLPPARREAEMTFGSGLREEVERVGLAEGVPQIGPLNRRIGEVVELRDVLQSGSNRINAHDTIGTAAFGPTYGAVRIGARPQLQSWIGGKLARQGDKFAGKASSIDPLAQVGNAGYRFDNAPSLRALHKTVTGVDDDLAQDWEQLARGMVPSHPQPKPGSGGDALDVLNQATPSRLDRYGIPVESPVPYTGRDPLDAVGVPVERQWPHQEISDEERWLRQIADQMVPSRSTVRGIPSTEDALQRGGVYGAAIDDTPAGRQQVGGLLGDDPKLTKQAVLEIYQRLQRLRNQVPQQGSGIRNFPE